MHRIQKAGTPVPRRDLSKWIQIGDRRNNGTMRKVDQGDERRRGRCPSRHNVNRGCRSWILHRVNCVGGRIFFQSCCAREPIFVILVLFWARNALASFSWASCTHSPVVLHFLRPKETGESGRSEVFFKQENEERIQSVPFSQISKAQVLTSVRFLKVRFFVDEAPLHFFWPVSPPSRWIPPLSPIWRNVGAIGTFR